MPETKLPDGLAGLAKRKYTYVRSPTDEQQRSGPSGLRFRLIALRFRFSLQKQEIAKALGVDVATYRLWEAGRYVPKFWDLISIVNLYNVRIEWLMLGKGDADN